MEILADCIIGIMTYQVTDIVIDYVVGVWKLPKGGSFSKRKYGRYRYYCSHHQQRPEHHIGRTVLICDMIIISSSHFVLKDREKVVTGL